MEKEFPEKTWPGRSLSSQIPILVSSGPVGCSCWTLGFTDCSAGLPASPALGMHGYPCPHLPMSPYHYFVKMVAFNYNARCVHHGRKGGKVYVLFSFSFRWVAHTVAQILEVDYSPETEAEWPKRERSPLEWDPAGKGRILE